MFLPAHPCPRLQQQAHCTERHSLHHHTGRVAHRQCPILGRHIQWAWKNKANDGHGRLIICAAKKQSKDEPANPDQPDAPKKRIRKVASAASSRPGRRKKPPVVESEDSSDLQPTSQDAQAVSQPSTASTVTQPPPTADTSISAPTSIPAPTMPSVAPPPTSSAPPSDPSPETLPSTSYHGSSITHKTPEQLALSRQGYQSFEMDGVELLISETADGQLSLKDCYVFEAGNDLYYEPEMQGDIPSDHTAYQCIPWTQEFLGDSLSGKEPWVKIQKMIFIPIETLTPYKLRMEDVFIFTAASRKLIKAEVQRVGPFIRDPILRIREDRVTIEDSSYVPDFMEVSNAAEEGREPRPAIDDALLRELDVELSEYQEEPSMDSPAPDLVQK